MNAKPLTVIARLKARPGQEEKLRQELLALVGPTRAEPDCINYDLHAAVDDPGLFIFHENWTGRAALDAHLQKPHLQAFFAQAEALLAEPVQLTLCHKLA